MQDLSNTGDAELVVLVGERSELALAEIYRRHGGAVFGLARRVLNNASEAEDVAQEVFVRLWTDPGRFDPARGALRSFLLTQSHARAVDILRTLSARRNREVTDAHRTAHSGYDLEHEMDDLTMAADVAQALLGLPEEERRAIELAYFEGHSYVMVAHLLNQPEGTVKSRIRNGMRRMRQALGESRSLEVER
jgi:RNA polymerase sigma-70 factor (ECF subfamily)